MDSPLFRPQVLEAKQARWLGGIALGQPLSLTVLALLAFAAAVAVTVFVATTDYTRRTRVAGQLVPALGLATVTAPTAGVVLQLGVDEGQRVLAGDVLAVVAIPRATRRDGDTAAVQRAALARRGEGIAGNYAAQREQLQAQEAGLAAQLAAAADELAQVEAERATRSAQLELAQAGLARFRELRRQRYVAELDLQQREAAMLEQLAAQQALERQALALLRQQAQLRQARAELPARRAALDAGERREQALLAQEVAELAARSESLVPAPLTGTIATRLVQPGQAVQAGQPLLSLLPAASALEAHLWVPSRAVGFVAPGDAVLLRYQAFPYQKFGQQRGRVVRISRSALAGGDSGAQDGEPLYRIVVALERPTVRAFGRDEPLRAGMLLEADIVGERRRLWEWALEPLYTLRGGWGEA